ncbi:hypothetical protein [Marinobacter zhanjiangensis]|uniref:Uncharacterized protein n=1 Tax=Marinobacter zhanjiangensis TaxID=578215 RepID=A0ABQ3BCI9_9GAMM|nr:hypothetical protein [Marinobacter zhanjiangensis]GGY84078.1 hypothetical protein GCM10007071_34250 [Marinobacter zhanjiangensis]
MFQLIFRGECQPGTDIETARNNARALFKASVEQVDRMFSGRPVVIRNRLEQDQAEKYRSVLARHGMVAHVEPMEESQPASPPPRPAPQPETSEQAAPATQPAGAANRDQAAAGAGPAVEPGDRLPVAGDKVDDLLAGSSLGLEPTGVRLSEERHDPAPMFQHLDEWTLAPAGTDLGVKRDTPPPVVPDVSHLSLAEVPDEKESGEQS